MTKYEKIFWFTLVLIIFVALVLLSGSIKKRYINPSDHENNPGLNQEKSPREKDDTQSETTDIPGEFLNEKDKGEDALEEKEIQEDLITENQQVKEIFLEIKKEDCENGCTDFSKNEEDFSYCQEVCGINPINARESEEECEDTEGLEEDYCLRDLAIFKKDYSLCEKIEDANISRMCRNRITEEIINGTN